MAETIEYRLPQLEYDPVTEYVAPKKDTVVIDDFYFTNNYMITTEVKLPNDYKNAQFKCTADMEFMNTSLGGHIAIGVPYANTPLADPPRKGKLQGRDNFEDNIEAKNMGMGTMWGDEIQLRLQANILYLEFGKPRFRSIFSNLVNSIDIGKSIIANEGRSTFFYNLGQASGEVARWMVMPGLTAAYEIGSLVGTLFMGDDFRYYSFKPDMHNYIQTANNILTQMQTERGLIKFLATKKDAKKDKYGISVTIDASMIKDLSDEYPDIIDPKYGFNMYNIVARPQLMVNQLIKANKDMIEKNELFDVIINNPTLKKFDDVISSFMSETGGLLKSTKDVMGKEQVHKKSDPVAETANINAEEYKTKDKSDGLLKRLINDVDDWGENFKNYYNAMSNYGMEYVALYVTYSGSSTITFSNETKDIPAKSVINTIGSASRDIRFSLGDGAFLGEAVDSVVKAGRDVALGVLNKTTFGLSNVIAGLIGGGYMSFPKMWSDSSVSLPTHSFTMRLGGPYSNPISNTIDIDVPLALLLGGTLPLNAGDTAYTAPFLLRAFIRGTLNIDFGMITSLTITASQERNTTGAPLYVDVSFTITDFSDVATAPVNDGIFGAFGGSTNEYDVLSKYLKGLGGRSYTDTRYTSKTLDYKLAVLKKNMTDMFNPAKYATMVGDSFIGDVVKLANSNKSITRLFE